jgi:hypothetical protein
MADFLERVARMALGVAPAIQPRVESQYAPGAAAPQQTLEREVTLELAAESPVGSRAESPETARSEADGASPADTPNAPTAVRTYPAAPRDLSSEIAPADFETAPHRQRSADLTNLTEAATARVQAPGDIPLLSEMQNPLPPWTMQVLPGTTSGFVEPGASDIDQGRSSPIVGSAATVAREHPSRPAPAIADTSLPRRQPRADVESISEVDAKRAEDAQAMQQIRAREDVPFLDERPNRQRPSAIVEQARPDAAGRSARPEHGRPPRGQPEFEPQEMLVRARIMSPQHGSPERDALIAQHFGSDTRARQHGSEPASLPPTVRITIGRVEVRAMMPPAQPVQTPAIPGPRLSLDEYLRQHSRRPR